MRLRYFLCQSRIHLFIECFFCLVIKSMIAIYQFNIEIFKLDFVFITEHFFFNAWVETAYVLITDPNTPDSYES